MSNLYRGPSKDASYQVSIHSDVFNWVKAKKISIVCFQETHSTKDVAVKWEDEWGSKCFF